MKFAIVDGRRLEAETALAGRCPCCDAPVIAKCGEIRTPHWAHKRRRDCDPWWENETEWHRSWKNHFPESWQEIVHRADDGQRHIADVKTQEGWVLEFQHSLIKPEERRARESFYPKLIWVVDGTRRIRDLEQFLRSWEAGFPSGSSSPIRRLTYLEGALLRDWAGSPAQVFFDFGDPRTLWWLLSGSDEAQAHVYCISRDLFIKAHQESSAGRIGVFDSALAQFTEFRTLLEREAYARATQNVQRVINPAIRGKARRMYRL